MNWDYADLSKAAKAAGGPKALVKKLTNAGMEKGRLETLKMFPPCIAASFCIGVAVTVICYNVYEYLKSEEIKADESIKEAEAELIEGIKAYDEAHHEPGAQGV